MAVLRVHYANDRRYRRIIRQHRLQPPGAQIGTDDVTGQAGDAGVTQYRSTQDQGVVGAQSAIDGHTLLLCRESL